MLIKVKTVAYHKFVGNGETHIIRLYGDSRIAALRLIQQSADLQGCRLFAQQMLISKLKRVAGVKNILRITTWRPLMSAEISRLTVI